MKRPLLLPMILVTVMTGYAVNPPSTLFVSGNVGIGSGETGGIQQLDGTDGVALSTEGNLANIFSVDGVVIADTDGKGKGYFYFSEKTGEDRGRKFGPATPGAAIGTSGVYEWLPAEEMVEGTDNCYVLAPGIYNLVVDCRTEPYKIQVQKYDYTIVDMQPIGRTGNYTGVVDESNKAAYFLIRIGKRFYTSPFTAGASKPTPQPLGMGFELVPFDFTPVDFINTKLLNMASNEIIGSGSATVVNNRRFFYNPQENNFIAINSDLKITTGSATSDMVYNNASGTFTGTVGKVKKSVLSFLSTGFFIGTNIDNTVYGETVTSKGDDVYSLSPKIFSSDSYCYDETFSQKKVTFDPLAMTLLLGEIDNTDPSAPEALYYCGYQLLEKEDNSNVFSGVVSIAPMEDGGKPEFYVCENSEFPYGYVIAVKDDDANVTPGIAKSFEFDTSLFCGLWNLDGDAGLYILSVDWDRKEMTVTSMDNVVLPEVPTFAELEKENYARFTGDATCEFNGGLYELYLSDESGALFTVELQNADEAVATALSPENFKRGDKLKNFSAIKLAKAHTFSIFAFDVVDGTPVIEKAVEEMAIPGAKTLGEDNVYRMVSMEGTLNISNYVGVDNTITVDGVDYAVLSTLAESHLTDQTQSAIIRRVAGNEWTLGQAWPTYSNIPGRVSGVVTPYNDGYAINATAIGSDITTGIGNEMTVKESPVTYYNLQGMRIDNPEAGSIVIRRQGTETVKIRF